MEVSPFKCGPDYIDTLFHSLACGRPSYNLDTFLASEAHIKYVYRRRSADTDISIVEGVMGLFDGHHKEKGSIYDLSRILDVPVILVIDAKSSAYSLAATIYGFTHFRPDVRIAGVVFNRVASPGHFSYLTDACADAGVRCFGYLPMDSRLATPSRHLGLTLSAEKDMETFISHAADAVEKHVDTSAILEACPTRSVPTGAPLFTPPRLHQRVAVARDEAFNFIYPENIDTLRRSGADITYFSPLRDSAIPHDADLVYLPGGYPELFARELSANASMKDSIRSHSEKSGKMLAECGGLMYLCNDIDGAEMCGIFPLRCTMDNARLTLGYRELITDTGSFRGHEFHYSRIVNPDAVASVARQFDRNGKAVRTPLYRHKNTFAGYTHLYWGESDINALWK